MKTINLAILFLVTAALGFSEIILNEGFKGYTKSPEEGESRRSFGPWAGNSKNQFKIFEGRVEAAISPGLCVSRKIGITFEQNNEIYFLSRFTYANQSKSKFFAQTILDFGNSDLLCFGVANLMKKMFAGWASTSSKSIMKYYGDFARGEETSIVAKIKKNENDTYQLETWYNVTKPDAKPDCGYVFESASKKIEQIHFGIYDVSDEDLEGKFVWNQLVITTTWDELFADK